MLKRARHKPEKYPWVTRLLERQTVQGRGCGGCQQDGARRLGVIGKGRQLSGACTCGGGVRVSHQQSEFASIFLTWTCRVMTTLMRNGRDRRSGKPVMGHAILERPILVGTRSADHIRASSHSGCIATGQASTRKTGRSEIHGCTRSLAGMRFNSSCHRGRRPYMAHHVVSLRCGIWPPSGQYRTLRRRRPEDLWVHGLVTGRGPRRCA